jgi:peptidyl-prolyl cis-trans isomerase-like protein 2
MVKSKEKQYQSASEHRANSQIRSGKAAAAGTHGVQRRLPFSCCALTLTPFENPVCNKEGIVFENSAILPFLMKHKMDPVTGNQPATSRDLITLNMDKDEEGRWQCPILTKPFADHTKIVAVIQRPEGNEANVYSYDAFHELNVKAKNYEDLISGKTFHKTKDVLILNDPNDDDLNRRRDINSFYHVTHGRELEQNKSNAGLVKHSMTATRIMEQLQKKKSDEAKAATKKRSAVDSAANPSTQDGKRQKVLAEDVLGVKYTTGKSSGSLTSTSMAVSYDIQAREATEEEILQARFTVMRKRKKKGYVRLRTTMGDLTLELHCDIVPRTCTNFFGLCQAGKYDDTRFHRLIPGFMIQGGKAKDGDDDESLWGGAFTDEFDDRLKHTGVGVLSMANSGTNTNRQQFFITFKSCNHLDRKHSIFGNIIDGTDLLTKMEKVPADKKERPIDAIKIIGTEILVNPVKEAEDLENQRLQELAEARKVKEDLRKGIVSRPKVEASETASTKSDVGRYLKEKLKNPSKDSASTDTKDIQGETAPSRLPPPPKKTTFGNFSGW